jgi:hypothetical protein
MVTSIGSPRAAALVNFDSEAYVFQAVPADERPHGVHGTLLYRKYEAGTDLDLLCEIPDDGEPESQAGMGLIIRGGLEFFDRQAGVWHRGGKCSSVLQPGEARWGAKQQAADADLAVEPRLLRLARDGNRISLYISSDSATWELLQSGRLELDNFYAGIIYFGSPAAAQDMADGRCRWLAPDSPLPWAQIDAKPERDGTYRLPLKLTLHAVDRESTLRYTLDGSEPDETSAEYLEPIQLEKEGRHEIRVRCFSDGKADDTVVAVVKTRE